LKNIYTIISECVASLRKVCTISSVSVSGTTYTCNTTKLNGIAVGLYVNFGTSKNYIVTEVVEYRYFKVVSDENLLTYRSAFIACAFLEGSGAEIAEIVSEKAKSNDYRYTNYPLLALIKDGLKFSEPGNTEVDGIELWLFAPSTLTMRTDLRISTILEPTLIPYFELFRTELENHKFIMETKNSLYNKIKYENKLGTMNLNEFTDSIKITINNLNIKY
jgi:hypothetical protein